MWLKVGEIRGGLGVDTDLNTLYTSMKSLVSLKEMQSLPTQLRSLSCCWSLAMCIRKSLLHHHTQGTFVITFVHLALAGFENGAHLVLTFSHLFPCFH